MMKLELLGRGKRGRLKEEMQRVSVMEEDAGWMLRGMTHKVLLKIK